MSNKKGLSNWYEAIEDRSRAEIMQEQLDLIEAQRKRIAELEAELKQWYCWGVVEIAVRNPNVSSYCEHWESRTIKAEEQNGRLEAELREWREYELKAEAKFTHLQEELFKLRYL
jgi:hypothetical protein